MDVFKRQEVKINRMWQWIIFWGLWEGKNFTVYVTRLMVVPIPEVDDSPTRVSASLKAEEGGSCRLKMLERKE